ncbi:MAG: DUF1330 domain-containing protein [Pseudomonadales bacterium]|nr:DUF1330 domain-containing protein [Pseudomonadales bacterium]
MSAYILMRIQVSDPSKLKSYQEVAPSIIEKYNGKLKVRGGEVVSLEGPNEHRRIVMVEFPSMDDAKKFYYSEEYGNAIKLRSDIADFEMIAVEGID